MQGDLKWEATWFHEYYRHRDGISNIFIRINVIVDSSVDVYLNPLPYPLMDLRLVLPSRVVVSMVVESTSYSTRLQGSINSDFLAAELRTRTSPLCVSVSSST